MSVTVCPSPLTAGAHLWWGIGPDGGHDGGPHGGKILKKCKILKKM